MKPKSWYRIPDVFDTDLRLLLYSMSLRRISMGFLGIVRAIYFALLGFSPVEIGFLLSLATFVSAIHHITFGMLSDRLGRKPFLIVGGVFATVRMVIFAVSSDFWMLALGQGIGAMGEGAGAGQPVVSGYIADKRNIENRSSIFSTLAITNGLAATLGSLMAGLPTYFQSALVLDVIAAHAVLFWIGAAAGAASTLILLPLKDVKSLRIEEEQKRGVLKAHSWGVIARFSLVRSTSGIGWSLIDSLMSLYFYLQFSIGSEVLGPVFAGARLLSVFSYVFVPPVVNRYGEIHALVVSRLVTASLAVLFSLSASPHVAIAILIAFRVVMMFSMPIRQTFATAIVDPSETATAIGVSNFARMGFRTIAPTLAGYMFETISLNMPFLTGALLLAVNGLLFRAFFKPKE